MSELRTFEVMINNLPHTLRLDKAAAELHGLDWDEKPATGAKPKRKAPANKAAKTEDK